MLTSYSLTFLPAPFDKLALFIGGLFLFAFAILMINFGVIYIRALFAGARVSLLELIALRLRRVPVGRIVDVRITAIKSGLSVSIDQLSTHHLAGGDVDLVILALIAARKAEIELSFDHACAIDLATKGTDKSVLEAVRTSVNPMVIDCPGPNSGRRTIDGIAKDGIVIRAQARVTVRSNLKRFVGGAFGFRPPPGILVLVLVLVLVVGTGTKTKTRTRTKT